jgi:predicted amidohydrolase YtcJ
MLVSALAFVAAPWGAAQTQPVDLVLNNGAVITVDARDSVAEAVAITGGKIVAVGSNARVKAFIGEKTQVIDLHGRTATPGLIDTHVHFAEAADVLDLGDPSIKNMADVIAKVKAWADKLPPGQGVRGVGWDEGKLAERRYITAADLDKAAPDRPVYLTHTTGHYGVANSMAMKLANITKDTKDPPAGTIDRDQDGNPTGVFKEAATGMVSRVVGNSGPRESQEAQVLRIIAGFNREGMTGAKDLNIGQAKWDLYKRLLEEGKLTVRVAALWQGGRTVNSVQNALQQMAALPKAPQTVGDGRLVLEGLKLYIDGSGGARTAWMYEDWNKDWTGTDAGNPGYPTTDPAIYREQVKLITAAGWSVGTHAIGDHGIDVVVDAYKDALEATGKKGLRHSIIHGNTPSDHAIETMAYLQKTFDAGYPEEQPPFMWWIGDTYAGNLGPKRAGRLEPLATFLKKGVMWAGGSDYSVTPYAGRYGLWASVARKTLNATYGATPFGTAESVNIHVALKSYTIWAAHQLFLEDRIGSLEPGKEADIAVWDKNLYSVPTDEIKNLQCELTMVAGKVVFTKPR